MQGQKGEDERRGRKKVRGEREREEEGEKGRERDGEREE